MGLHRPHSGKTGTSTPEGSADRPFCRGPEKKRGQVVRQAPFRWNDSLKGLWMQECIGRGQIGQLSPLGNLWRKESEVDLFGDEVTAPRTVVKRTLINAAHGFPEFWKAWPSGPRKVAKQQCLDKWATKECANCADLILRHVEWLKESDDWKRGFICAPLVYLNQQRWLDWEPPVKRKEPNVNEMFAKRDREAAKPSAETRQKIAALLGRKQ